MKEYFRSKTLKISCLSCLIYFIAEAVVIFFLGKLNGIETTGYFLCALHIPAIIIFSVGYIYNSAKIIFDFDKRVITIKKLRGKNDISYDKIKSTGIYSAVKDMGRTYAYISTVKITEDELQNDILSKLERKGKAFKFRVQSDVVQTMKELSAYVLSDNSDNAPTVDKTPDLKYRHYSKINPLIPIIYIAVLAALAALMFAFITTDNAVFMLLCIPLIVAVCVSIVIVTCHYNAVTKINKNGITSFNMFTQYTISWDNIKYIGICDIKLPMSLHSQKYVYFSTQQVYAVNSNEIKALAQKKSLIYALIPEGEYNNITDLVKAINDDIITVLN